MRLALRLTSSCWCVCACLTQLYMRRPSLLIYIDHFLNGQRDKSGQRSRNVLPPFSSPPRCVSVRMHTHTHACTALPGEFVWLSVWRCRFTFVFLISVRMMSVKVAKNDKQMCLFLFSVASLVDKLFVLLWEAGWKKPVSISFRLQDVLIIQRETLRTKPPPPIYKLAQPAWYFSKFGLCGVMQSRVPALAEVFFFMWQHRLVFF